MKKNRIIALLLASLMCTSAITSCGDSKKTEKPAENTDKTEIEQPSENGETTEVAPPSRDDYPVGLEAYDWKYDDDEIMFTIGGHPITFDEYRFIVMGEKIYRDNGDNSYWTEETEKEIKDTVLSTFKMLAATKLYADKNNVVLEDSDFAMIDDHFSSFVTQLGEDGFENLLNQNYVSKDTYRDFLEYDLYTMKLTDTVEVSEEDILSYANENYVHVQHVLIGTIDKETGTTYEAEKLAEKKKLADEIAAKAKNGEDFYSLVEEYGEDPGMENNPDGYTFTFGEMVAEFEAKSFELAVGEVSDPVETSYGYHIIKKLPLDVTPESVAYSTGKNILAQTKLGEDLAVFAEELEIVFTDAYNNLTMTNIGTLTEAAKKAAEVVDKVSESTVVEEAPEAKPEETETETEPETEAEAE